MLEIIIVQERVFMNSIASVAVSNSTREFDREYHYLIPDDLADKVKPGVRVIVPFGKSDRPYEAYVLGIVENTGMYELKEVKKAIDENPVLNDDLLKLSSWMRVRYICTYSDAIRCMLPPGTGIKSARTVRFIKDTGILNKNGEKILDALVEHGGECVFEELRELLNLSNFTKCVKELEESGAVGICESYMTRIKEKSIRVAYLARPREEIVDEIESNRIRRIQQIRVLEMLLDNEFIPAADIIRFSSVTPGVLDTLKKYGYIDFKDIEINRNPLKASIIARTEPLYPTPQQAEVLQKIKKQMDKGEFGEVLLHGVTGSGKTEVYLQLIQYCIEKGKQAIVMVPEISLTPQMLERFKGRFGDQVAVLHSRLSLGERYDQWKLIKDGSIKVAVGARSAVFAPFGNLGMIIIDEEHENSYKSDLTPKYNARDVARERCLYKNAALLYGSATPSLETYYKAKNGDAGYTEISERANKLLMPCVEIVDMRNELDAGNRSIFSRKLIEEIDKNIKSGRQTMLFLNRRGYSSFVLCRKCGYTVKCANCSISLTYHAFEDRLICHYCGYTDKSPGICPKCGSSYIRHFGTGTQKVEDEIKKRFPGCSVIRMDMDTTTRKNSHEEILRAFREQNINIMVGTQMIAKGHDFPNITLVGVLAADSLLNTGDYKASERTFQLITQVAGRAGRGELPGRAIIQTYNTEDFSIIAACKHDYVLFYSQEIMIRKKLDYPPFTNLAAVILSCANDRRAFNKAKDVKNTIDAYFMGYEGRMDVLGPARSPLSKIKNKYRWRIVIKCDNLDKLISVLSTVSDGFNRKKEKNTVELNMDINPVNML